MIWLRAKKYFFFSPVVNSDKRHFGSLGHKWVIFSAVIIFKIVLGFTHIANFFFILVLPSISSFVFDLNLGHCGLLGPKWTVFGSQGKVQKLFWDLLMLLNNFYILCFLQFWLLNLTWICWFFTFLDTNGLFLELGWDSKTVLGYTHVVQHLLLSIVPSKIAFDFDLILRMFLLFGVTWPPWLIELRSKVISMVLPLRLKTLLLRSRSY